MKEEKERENERGGGEREGKRREQDQGKREHRRDGEEITCYHVLLSRSMTMTKDQ